MLISSSASPIESSAGVLGDFGIGSGIGSGIGFGVTFGMVSGVGDSTGAGELPLTCYTLAWSMGLSFSNTISGIFTINPSS